jgi:hypothetical protein
MMHTNENKTVKLVSSHINNIHDFKPSPCIIICVLEM